MSQKTVVVFTAKSVEACLEVGGTQSWVLDPSHAKRCEYVVLCQNRYTDWGDGKEAHHSAFLIARIADVVSSTDTPERWLIRFEEYARISFPGIWKGWRNPVRYTTLDELGVSLDNVSFKPVPKRTKAETKSAPEGRDGGQVSVKAEVEAARQRIGLVAGVPPEAVKITIEFGMQTT